MTHSSTTTGTSKNTCNSVTGRCELTSHSLTSKHCGSLLVGSSAAFWMVLLDPHPAAFNVHFWAGSVLSQRAKDMAFTGTGADCADAWLLPVPTATASATAVAEAIPRIGKQQICDLKVKSTKMSEPTPLDCKLDRTVFAFFSSSFWFVVVRAWRKSPGFVHHFPNPDSVSTKSQNQCDTNTVSPANPTAMDRRLNALVPAVTTISTQGQSCQCQMQFQCQC